MISPTTKDDLLTSISVIMDHYDDQINSYDIITQKNSIEVMIQPLSTMTGNDYVDLLVLCRDLLPKYDVRILDDSAYIENTASFSLTYAPKKETGENTS